MALVFPTNPAVGAGLHALCLLLAAAVLIGVATSLCAIAGIALLIGCAMLGGTLWSGLAWSGVLAALALLGGGAWSLDARLFGKRVIRISG